MRILAAVTLAALAAAGAAVGIGYAGASKATVKVKEHEWGVAPIPVRVRAGKVTFVVRDAGHLDHEFVVIKTKRAASKLPLKGTRAVETGRVGRIPKFKPGQTRTITLTLKAGHYALICNLPAHYKAGQHTDFYVK